MKPWSQTSRQQPEVAIPADLLVLPDKTVLRLFVNMQAILTLTARFFLRFGLGEHQKILWGRIF